MTAMRVAAGRSGCCALFLVVAGLALTDVVLPAAFAEETEHDEVSIGTFKLAPRAKEPVRSDRAQPPVRYETASEESGLNSTQFYRKPSPLSGKGGAQTHSASSNASSPKRPKVPLPGRRAGISRRFTRNPPGRPRRGAKLAPYAPTTTWGDLT
jgi:hypothetical protein